MGCWPGPAYAAAGYVALAELPEGGGGVPPRALGENGAVAAAIAALYPAEADDADGGAAGAAQPPLRLATVAASPALIDRLRSVAAAAVGDGAFLDAAALLPPAWRDADVAVAVAAAVGLPPARERRGGAAGDGPAALDVRPVPAVL